MDLNAESYEFLDLSDIDDSERTKLIRTLYNNNNNNYNTNNDYDTTLPTLQPSDQLNHNDDNGITFKTNNIHENNIIVKTKSSSYGININNNNNNNNNCTTANKEFNYKFNSCGGGIKKQNSKYSKNVAPTTLINGQNNNNNQNISNNINKNDINCLSQSQQLLSTNENSIDSSGHLIRNLMFPVPPQFLPHLIPSIPICAIVKPTFLTDATNNIFTTTNSSSISTITAVVPLRTPKLTASAAVKSHEDDDQLQENRNCGELINCRKDNSGSNHINSNNSSNQQIDLIPGNFYSTLTSKDSETDRKTKKVATMAQHTQPSLHQQQQSQQQITSQQQNNNYQQHHQQQQHHQHAYTQVPSGVYMPTHGGAMYSMMPTSVSPNVYVNNVTANVNVHGWTGHSVPTAYIPGNGAAYLQAGDIPQTITHEQVMQQVQHTNSMSRTNRRGRSSGSGRGNSANRRNDYNQRNQQQEASPVPQELVNSIDQQPQTFHPYGGAYQYAAYPQFFAAPQQAINHTQAQHATGPPLYLASSVFSAVPQLYNYPGGIIYSPHMMPHEYPMVDERIDDQTQQQQQQHIEATGMMAPSGAIQQHPQQMWHTHGMPIEYHEEYELVGGSGDDINHNQSPLTASDHTPSMLSPAGHQIYYDPNMQQTIDMHQQMNSLHIYDQQVVMAAAVQQQHQAMQHAEEQHQQQMQEQQQQQHIQVMHDQPQVMMILPNMSDYRQQQQIETEQEIDHMGNNINEMSPENVQHPGQLVTEEQHIYMQQQQQQLILMSNNNIAGEEIKSDIMAIPDYNQNMLPNIVQENVEIESDYLPQANETDTIESPVTFVNNSNNNQDFDHDNNGQHIHEYETIPVSTINEPPPPIISHLPTINNNVDNSEIENSVSTSVVAVVATTIPATTSTTVAATKTMSWTNQTKKLTASVAVTALPEQTTNQTQKPTSLQSSSVVPAPVTNKITTNNNTTVTMPSMQVKNQATNLKQTVVNASPSQLTNSHSNLERKLSGGQYTEQKSIASAVVPQQLQENTTGQIKKQQTIIIENQTRTTKRHTDESKSYVTNNNNHINQQNIQSSAVGSLAPPPPAPQTQTSVPVASASSGPLSWASLFANKTAANQNQYNNNTATTTNNNSSIQTGFINSLGSNVQAVHTKPIAKVSPYEGTSNIPIPQAEIGNSAGTMSYSAASARGIPSNSNINSTNQNRLTGGSKQKISINPQTSNNASNSTTEDSLDEWSTKFAEFLKKYKTDFTPVSLRPRGLTNPNNYCYINAVLQALIACPPFFNLLKSMPKQSIALHNDKSKIPTINAMTQFANEFYNLPAGARLNRREKVQKINNKQDDLSGELQCDPAFEATSIYKLWNLSRAESDEGRQGDAEEFLGFVLNKLNDEMLEVIKILAKPAPVIELNGDASGEPDDGGDDWQMIYNNRNKGSVTRQADFGKTPISDIFRGELRSRLQREGEHSTDVIQPFFTLQLNIEKAASVREALEILVGRDQLEGVTCSKTNQEVVAWQQMNLEKLPYVLIFHLKWFDYKLDGCTKIVKNVEFPVELKIDTKILASKKYSQKQKLYRLFAVVYHDGKEATKGHYISDVYHTGYMSWLRCDDQNVKPISEHNVLRPRGLRVPYLLYYRRADTIAASPPSSTLQTQQSGNSIGTSNSGTHNHTNK